MENRDLSISIIGSFKQHYDQVREAWNAFTQAGIVVTSPKGTGIIEEGLDFVRFESDPIEIDDCTVQSLAMHRILRADLTYVVAPRGYVGRTTCYEIGRIIQARHPVYFSEHPHDLPVLIPMNHVCEPHELVHNMQAADWRPTWLYKLPPAKLIDDRVPESSDPRRLENSGAAPFPSCVELEQGLIYGNYRSD